MRRDLATVSIITMSLMLPACGPSRPPTRPIASAQAAVGAPVGPAPDASGTATSDVAAAASLPGVGQLTIAGRNHGPILRVELARSDEERTRGLMFRRHLDDNAGMLFFMGSDSDWSFWMRNTYIALDMIFIDVDWNVVGVLAAVPPLNEVGRSVGRRSRYVLELAAHQAERHGIAAGTQLIFADVTRGRQ